MRSKQLSEHGTTFAKGGKTAMHRQQAAGPAKPAVTGKAQTAAPGKRAASGGPKTHGVSVSKAAAAGRTGPVKGR
jgi:hypothetical protein